MICVWKVGPYSQKLLEEMEERKGNRNAVGVSKRQ